MGDVIFSDGFESADFSNWNATENSPTIVQTPLHHGSYAMQAVLANSASTNCRASKNITSTSEAYLRCYVRMEDLFTGSGLKGIGPRFYYSGGARAYAIVDCSNHKWGVRNHVNSETFYETGTSEINADEWYCLELYMKIDSSNGELKLWVNGELKIEQIGLNTGTDNITGVSANTYSQLAEGTERTIYLDSVACADKHIGLDPEYINNSITDEALFVSSVPHLTNWEIVEGIYGWVLSNLTYNSAIDNPTLRVVSVTGFEVGDLVTIEDDDESAQKEIQEINPQTNTLTMTQNIGYEFDTTKNARVYIWKPGKRLFSKLDADAQGGVDHKVVSVVSVEEGHFEVGDIVTIADGDASETNKIAIVDAVNNNLTMAYDLSNDYQNAQGAHVDGRKRWDIGSFDNPKNHLRFKDSDTGHYYNIFLVTVTGDKSADDPLFVLDEGMVVKKDISAGGFVGSNQGELWLGHGRADPLDPPKIILTHSSHFGYDPEYATLHLRKLEIESDGFKTTTPAHMSLGNLTAEGTVTASTVTATQLDIPAQHDVFSVIAGDEGPDTDVYLVPQNPSNATGLGLGTSNVPFKWVDATNVFADTLNGLTDVDLTITPNAGRKVVIDGDLQVTGDLSTGTQKGDATTDSNGDCTVNFAESFDSAPLVFVQSQDSSGRGVRFDVTSKSTSSFTVKATVLPVNHKHKIGQALATVDWTMGIDNATGEHKHGFDGVAAVDLAHTHGTHQHGFGIGNEQAAVDLAHSHGTHQHGFGAGAEQAAVDLAHSHGTHQHGFGAGNEAAAVDLTHSHGSHSHSFSGSGGTTSNGSHAHASAGSHSHGMTGTGVQTGITSGHSHLYYVVSGWATASDGSHSHASAGSHSHSVSVSGTTGSTTVSLGSTISYVGGNTAFSTISLSQTLATVGGNTAYTTVSLGTTISTVGGNTAFTDLTLGETLAYVGGYTQEDAAHGHDLSNKAPYARSIQLRDISGSVVEAGGTMTTVSASAQDLYTETADLSAESLEVDFDWMAIPA
ncbi:MAG: hypothetical protein CW716_09620 [Candidatus Bathyarchaeum sp.]|nr:MAG: hypothetical protein CW716_09620 [Candidatus Bathyarchaeum sp.]